jgi:hypothetical protein
MQHLNIKLSRWNLRIDPDSRGEKDAAKTSDKDKLAFDRRVDIFSSHVAKRPGLKVQEPLLVKGPEPNKFAFKSDGGKSASVGIWGVQELLLRIKNPRTKKTALYSYAGTGPCLSLPVGFSLPSSSFEYVPLPAWLNLKDFEGSGRVTSLAVGKSGSILEFDGPKSRRKYDRTLRVVLTGFDLAAGGQVDWVGRWSLMGIA